ncbi:MAG: DegV family protein [Christensenellales bacterium]
MKDYLLFMDVSGDIDESYVKQKGVKLLPMEFLIDDRTETYTADGQGMDLVKFYDEIKNKKVVKTSQISPFGYEEYFSPYLKQGYSCLYLGISKGLSSAYQSSLVAVKNLKQEFPDVDLISVDTDQVTAPLGLLVERMVENKEKGMNIQENVEDLLSIKKKIKGFAVVDDLKALKRGGRISATTAFFGSMLNIKPIISIYDGTLHVIDKQKGIKNSLVKLGQLFKENYNPKILNSVYIVDACEKENADSLEKILKEIAPDCNIKRKLLTPIVGAHLGSGAMVVTFYGD